MTAFKKQTDPKTGDVLRVDVQRKGLRARLWFEKSGASFNIRHQGSDADFSTPGTPGEPIHIREAREALRDVGLDMNRCSWEDIVKKAV